MSQNESHQRESSDDNDCDNIGDENLSINDWQERRVQSKKFIVNLRHAFQKADVEEKGWLTFDQWVSSSIRKFIQDGKITDDQYRKYFKRIDANADGQLTWAELVYYLMKEIASGDMKVDDASVRFIHKALLPTPSRKEKHRDMIIKIKLCERTGEYVTLSPDSIRFWGPSDLSFRRSFDDPGCFRDFIMCDHPLLLAAVTTERRLVFYDVDSMVRLPVEVSGSPSASKIKEMSQVDAVNELKTLESATIPMFNIPTCICHLSTDETTHIVHTFCIGDEQGIIEVYRLDMPKRRKGNDYFISRIGRKEMHTAEVTQISKIEILGCLASSSSDGTVKFFTFVPVKNSFTVNRVFTDDCAVGGFLFSPIQKVLVTYGVSRDAYVWSLSPTQKISKLGGHYNQVIAATDFVTSSNDKYFLTMTNKKEFRLWDSVNYRMIYEWSDPEIQRPENYYSAVMFDEQRHTLITCSAFPSKWAEDCVNSDKFELLTHNHPIVDLHYSKEFDQVISVDKLNNFKIWNYETGRVFTEHQTRPESPEISACSLDTTTRRLLSAEFGGNVSIWNFNSGTEIASFQLPSTSPFISVLNYTRIGGRSYLIRGGWDKTIKIYSEDDKCRFTLYRSFVGHKADISCALGYCSGLVSGSVDGQVFSWMTDTTQPQAVVTLTPSASVECMACTGCTLIVGDSIGNMHVMMLPRLCPVMKIRAHSLVIQHALTSLEIDDANGIMYSSDTVGYVKKWKLTTDPDFKIEDLGIARCHHDEIMKVVTVGNGKYLATCGIDKCVRLWTSDFNFIGFFHAESKWNIEDPTTWSRRSDCEVEPQHFAQQLRKPHTSNLVPRCSVKNLPVAPIQVTARMASLAPTIAEEAKPFDLEEAAREINEYCQTLSFDKKYSYATLMETTGETEHQRYALTEPGVTLETMSRPGDLINQVDKLISAPGNASEPARTARLATVRKLLQKPTLKKRDEKAEPNRLPLTLTFY